MKRLLVFIKITTVILVYVLTGMFTGTTAAAAAIPERPAQESFSNYEKAVDLKILGLFANTPDKFGLERELTRVEGAVMLLRLLGIEEEAKQEAYSHPFADVPDWADSYIGYLYQNGLTKGIGNSLFGTDNLMSANQYITFVLRSMGYEDRIDFDYSKATDKAVQLGILSEAEAADLNSSGVFLRNDMVGISYNALSAKLKASHKTLLDKLAGTDKCIYKPAAKALGLYTYDLKPEYTGIEDFQPARNQYGYVVKNSEDMFELTRKALYLYETKLNMDVRGYSGSVSDDFDSAFSRARAVVEEITGVEHFVASWQYKTTTDASGRALYFEVTVQYRYTRNDFVKRSEQSKEALNKARDIVARMITPDMTDYDKEKLLHDYIINNTRYDYENYLKGALPDEAFEEYGCLIKGVAVCEGYSEAMKLLCDLSGIEGLIVSGQAECNGRIEGHSWNMIKIDGAWYHLDVTNDDPVSGNGKDILVYYYFNLPDSEAAYVNTWERSKYPECVSIQNNYYYRNGMVAGNRSDFEKALLKVLEFRESEIEMKISDYSRNTYSDITDFVLNKGTVSEFSYSIYDALGIIRIFDIQYY